MVEKLIVAKASERYGIEEIEKSDLIIDFKIINNNQKDISNKLNIQF